MTDPPSAPLVHTSRACATHSPLCPLVHGRAAVLCRLQQPLVRHRDRAAYEAAVSRELGLPDFAIRRIVPELTESARIKSRQVDRPEYLPTHFIHPITPGVSEKYFGVDYLHAKGNPWSHDIWLNDAVLTGRLCAPEPQPVVSDDPLAPNFHFAGLIMPVYPSNTVGPVAAAAAIASVRQSGANASTPVTAEAVTTAALNSVRGVLVATVNISNFLSHCLAAVYRPLQMHVQVCSTQDAVRGLVRCSSRRSSCRGVGSVPVHRVVTLRFGGSARVRVCVCSCAAVVQVWDLESRPVRSCEDPRDERENCRAINPDCVNHSSIAEVDAGAVAAAAAAPPPVTPTDPQSALKWPMSLYDSLILSHELPSTDLSSAQTVPLSFFNRRWKIVCTPLSALRAVRTAQHGTAYPALRTALRYTVCV
jgi:hypothetical protein